MSDPTKPSDKLNDKPNAIPSVTPGTGSALPLCPLGRSGLQVAPLVFGGNVFGWTADRATSFSLLDAFVDSGFNLIDTADVYSRWVPGHSGGESETIIGQWLAAGGQRDRVLTAPICSATSTAQWAELAGAARLVLAPVTLAALDLASAESDAAG
jgi:aryl-alcohol dehydrogenase-like predicted oxidoreductase